jgi:hypothetical protein
LTCADDISSAGILLDLSTSTIVFERPRCGMKLSKYETIQLYTAGTVTIPKDFPEVGEVTITTDGIEVNQKTEPLLTCVRNVSPSRTIKYILPLKSVAAILVATEGEEGDKLDPFDSASWKLGQELMENSENRGQFLSEGDGKPPRGSVFVTKHTQVLVQTVTKMAAADIGAEADGIVLQRSPKNGTAEVAEPGGEPPCRCPPPPTCP